MDSDKAFRVLAIAAVFILIADRILFVIFPNYLLNKNFSATQIGLVFSIASLILLVSRTFVGKISDIVGRKSIMSLGYFLEALSILVYPFISKFYQFSLAKGLQETSSTLSESVKDALIADLFGKKVRSRYIRKLGNVIPLGKAIAMLVGFATVTYFSLITGFYVAAFSLSISSVLLFLFVKETRQKSNNTMKMLFSMRKYSAILKTIIIVNFLQSIVFAMAYFPGFFILARNLGITENMLFLILLAVYVSGSLIIFLTRRFVDSIDKFKLALASLAGFSIFILMYSSSKSILQFSSALFFVHLFYAYYWIGLKTVLLNGASKKFRGEQLGFNKTLEGVGNMIGPAIGGFLIDTVSLSSTFLLSGALGLFAVILAIFINKKLT